MSKLKFTVRKFGGPTSGNWGHAGRADQLGGSASSFPSQPGAGSQWIPASELQIGDFIQVDESGSTAEVENVEADGSAVKIWMRDRPEPLSIEGRKEVLVIV